MSKVNREEALADKENGKTSAEIAEKFGVSRQYISQILSGKDIVATPHQKAMSQIKYSAIADYLKTNRISMKSFYDEYITEKTTSYPTYVNFLYGKSKGNLLLVIKLIQITGLSIEELFKEELI